MAITITPKYKPFTYEELVKPLEGYWEKYDKAEEDLVKLETDTAVLQSVIDSMPEGEEKTKYTNYLSSLNSQAEALASQGLTRDNRNALRNIKTQYSALIPRLSLAEEARRKDLASYTQRANSGEYFMDSGNSPLNKSVIDYLDGNVPLYNNGINKKTLGADVENVAKAYSSRIFPETNIEEVEKIKNKFIKVTQEQGVNADFSQVEGNEQFMPILNTLYEQYGIDQMTGEEQASAKDFVNRKFWEGLVYKKAEDYQKNVVPRDPKDSSKIIDLRMTDSQGNRLVKVGGQIVAITGENPDGSFIVDKWTAVKPESTSQQQKENERRAFESTFVGGYDSWRDNTVYNQSWTGRHIVGDMDENSIELPSDIVGMYIKNLLKKDGDRIPRSDATMLIAPENMNIAFTKAQRNFTESQAEKIAQYGLTEKDMVGFHIGGHVVEDKNGLNKNTSEWLGDNHIRLIPAQSVIEQVSHKNVDEQIKILTQIRNAYNRTGTKNPYKIVKLADEYMKDILKNQLEISFSVDEAGNLAIANQTTLNSTLKNYKKAFKVDSKQAFQMAFGANGEIIYKEYNNLLQNEKKLLQEDINKYKQLMVELEKVDTELTTAGIDSLTMSNLRSQRLSLLALIEGLEKSLSERGYDVDSQSDNGNSTGTMPDISTY